MNATPFNVRERDLCIHMYLGTVRHAPYIRIVDRLSVHHPSGVRPDHRFDVGRFPPVDPPSRPL